MYPDEVMAIFQTTHDVENFVYASYMKALPHIPPGLPDKDVRNPIYSRMLLDKLGRPDAAQYNLLVTGSKGKGSVSRMVSSLLQAHGYKVGLFSGPHLVQFNERIRINGRAVSDQDLMRYADLIQPAVDGIQSTLPANHYLGPVGIIAVMAMLYFLDNATQYNVIECGKGARYDDVNMVSSNGSLINTVFEEHMPKLGTSIVEIARDKAAVIKSTQDFTLSAAQRPEVHEIIRKEANSKGVPLYSYDHHFCCKNVEVTSKGTRFDVSTEQGSYPNLSLRLLGRHQAYNAALAIGAAEKILGGLDADRVAHCFQNLTWPGRLEIIDHDPTVVLDGCINRECAQYIAEFVESTGKKQVVFIVGIPDDKDYMGVIQRIKPLAAAIILTQTKNRYLKFCGDQLQRVKDAMGGPVYFAPTIDQALHQAQALVSAEDMVCIIGTQSLVKDTKELFHQDTLHLDG